MGMLSAMRGHGVRLEQHGSEFWGLRILTHGCDWGPSLPFPSLDIPSLNPITGNTDGPRLMIVGRFLFSSGVKALLIR